MATRAAKLALRGKALSDTGTEIGIVNNADATAITIHASENVGIGNTASGFNGQADNLSVGTGSGANGITIYSGNDSSGNIFFADGTSGDDPTRGGINYNHANNSISFRVNDAPKMVIDSPGNVLVGKTTTDFGTEGIVLFHSNDTNKSRLHVTSDSTSGGYFNRLGNDGEAIRLYRQGILVGGVGVTSTGAYITLGGTGNANTLDDYEEGTWTPSITRDSNPSIGSYAVRYGSYTKIGNQVTLFCEVVSSTVSGGSGVWKCTGLPFSSAGINANTTVGRNYMSGDTNDRDFRIHSNVAKLISTSADTYYQGNITYVIWTFTTTFQVS